MTWWRLPFMMAVLMPCANPNLVHIAGNKPTFQSSTFNLGASSAAVDGNKNRDYNQGSCTHTDMTTNPWWAVDLLWSRQVESVYLTNRDVMGKRLNSIRIGTTDMNPDTTAPTPRNFAICASQDAAVGDGVTQEFACGGKGRYLVVLLEGTDKVLTLCEVEVYARNIAHGRPTYQSGTRNDGFSSNAVDGNRDTVYNDGSCTHTDHEVGSHPWWAVDLQWSHLVESVDLTNRAILGSRLYNIRIGTTNMDPATTSPTPQNIDICESQDGAVGDGATQEFRCGGKGRYLVVLLEGSDNVLTLCEVEVYSSRTELQFQQNVYSRLVGYMFESLEVDSQVECASLCLMNSPCSSFNLRSVTSGSMTCELNDDISEDQITSGLTTDPQYAFYKIYHQE